MAATTSIRVSVATLEEIERLRVVFHEETADGALQRLIRERRSRALRRLAGAGEGTVRPFSHRDRVDAHD